MSYTGGRLRPWFSSDPVAAFLRRGAHAGGQALQRRTRERTPVRTGALRESIYQTPVVVLVNDRGERVYESRAATDLDYAAPIEHGWGLWGPKHAKYPITPKDPNGYLHWIDPTTGQDVYAKRVMHPGAPGAHMFAIAAGLVEAEFDEIIRPHLDRWARETERQNRSDWNLGAGRL